MELQTRYSAFPYAGPVFLSPFLQLWAHLCRRARLDPRHPVGSCSGELLPARLLSALNVALYGMFLAVVIPPAKTSRILTGVILASMALSLVVSPIVPLLAGLSSGFKIILLTILIAGAAAILFPVKEEE